MYKFKFKGMNFSCDLDDITIISELVDKFGDDIKEIIENKDLYRVKTEVELLKDQLQQTQDENKALAETLDMILVDVLPSLMP